MFWRRPLLNVLRFDEPFASKWRQFLFLVHPDFFSESNDKRLANEESLKDLATIAQPHNAGQVISLQFWVRSPTGDEEPAEISLDLTVQRSIFHTLQPLLGKVGIPVSAADGELDTKPIFQRGHTDLAWVMESVKKTCQRYSKEYKEMEAEARLLERLIYNRVRVPVSPRRIHLEPYLHTLKRWWQELEVKAMKPVLQAIPFRVLVVPEDEAPPSSSCAKWGDVWHDDLGDVSIRCTNRLSYVVQFIHSRRTLVDRAFKAGGPVPKAIREARGRALDECIPLRSLHFCPSVGLAHQLAFAERFAEECAIVLNSQMLLKSGGEGAGEGADGALHLAVTSPATRADHAANGFVEVPHDLPTGELLDRLFRADWAGPARRRRQRARARAVATEYGDAVTEATGVRVLINDALDPPSMAYACHTLHTHTDQWHKRWYAHLPIVVCEEFRIRGDGALCIPWHASFSKTLALPE